MVDEWMRGYINHPGVFFFHKEIPGMNRVDLVA